MSILTALINRKDNHPDTFKDIFASHEKMEEFSSLKMWFIEAKVEKEASMSAVDNMGFVKIAFTFGLKVLYFLGKQKETINPDLF